MKREPKDGGNSQNRGKIMWTKVGLNWILSFKKTKISPSQQQSAPWGEQRSKAKSLYKVFIFGELCGVVFGRALTLTRPTVELETEGRRPQVGCCLLHPYTPE